MLEAAIDARQAVVQLVVRREQLGMNMEVVGRTRHQPDLDTEVAWRYRGRYGKEHDGET